MEDSLGSSDSEKELKHELVDAGIKLLNPPSSTDELLKLLDKVENILSQVGQDPSSSMRDALSSSMNALVSDELLMHSLMDVKVSVVSCIHEIVRITAPCQPYADDKMKEIFELTIIVFRMLSHLSGHCYSKALQILETVARVRSCVILLDLGCDALIVQLFQLFFDTIRCNHPHSVFSNMEEIMTWLIDESDEISLELLKSLLASVRKENQGISPLSWKLGEEVLKCCSAKLKPYLSKAVKVMKTDFDDYSEVVTSLYQDEPSGRNLVTVDVKPDAVHLKEIGLLAAKLCKPLQDNLTGQERNENVIILKDQNSLKTLESLSQLEQLKSTLGKSALRPQALPNGEDMEAKADGGATPRKRGRKPNSLMKPEEGYRHNSLMKPEEGYRQSCTVLGKHSLEIHQKMKNHQNVVNLAKNLSPEESPRMLHADFVNSPNNEGHSGNDTNRKKRGRPTKKESTTKGHFFPVQVEENGEQNLKVALKKGSDNAEDAEGKPKRGSRRKRRSMISDGEAIPDLSLVIVKEENDALTDSDAKLCPSLNHMDGSKATEEKVSPEKQNTREFGEKTMLSPVNKVPVRDENLSLSIVKSKRQRKRALQEEELMLSPVDKVSLRNENLSVSVVKSKSRRKKALQEEEGFKRPTLVKEYGEELVGSRIKVWWPLDQMFYEGVIRSFYPATKKHKILYIDGDKEILNLNKERWMLLDDASSDQVQEADFPTSAVIPANKLERTKAKRITKFKIKQDNSFPPTKRSKSAPPKCGSKSAESSTLDSLCMKDLDNAKANTGSEEKDCNETGSEEKDCNETQK